MRHPFTKSVRSHRFAALLLVAVAAAGCGDAGGTANVTGAVLVDGQLASRGMVTFHPKGDGVIATGRVHEDGSFSMQVGQGNRRDADASRIPIGDYVVTVVVTGEPRDNPIEGAPPIAGPRLMAARYGSRDSSDLMAKVVAGDNLLSFDLEAAEPTPEAAGDSADEPPSDEPSPGDSTAKPSAEAAADGPPEAAAAPEQGESE